MDEAPPSPALPQKRRIDDGTLLPRSRICDWTDTNLDEMYTYFAIILAMGIVINSKLEEYWTADEEIFTTPGFRVHMRLDRFQLISACLHFSENGTMSHELSAAEAKLFKIEPIITHLNAKFQSIYTMGQNIALDASLMQWKGCLSINQFIGNKAAKIGVKTYELCESHTGYLWRRPYHG
ncbi:transposase IS4 domain-containing protein [Phthorimaea operculella]|nr:transposase IS4 domain-containing protein [Phthorimaea operculella]